MAKKKPAKPETVAKKKSDESEVAKRVDEVLRIVLDGAQTHDVLQYASEKSWNVSERQVRTYIARAHELLIERQDKKRKPVIARHIAQRQALFARAVNAADLRTALAILDSECKLRGLFPEASAKELLKLLASQEERLKKVEGNTDAAAPRTGATPNPEPDSSARRDRGAKP